MSQSLNQSATDLNDTTSQNMENSEQELVQGVKLTQLADAAEPLSTAGSVSTAPPDIVVDPTSNTRNVPTVNVDDSATLGAIPSDPGTSGEGHSNQPTALWDSGLQTPPNEETNSVVQPGVHVFDSQLPPPLSGTLRITVEKKKDGGRFVDVYRGELEHPNGETEFVAIKCIRCADGTDEQRFQMRIRRETVIWKAADHPNILRFIGYQLVGGIPWLVSPWCKHRSLTTYIANTAGITRADKIDLLCGAARGLLHLHSLSPIIVHGDIKPDNVVIKDDLEAALCDFGMSRLALDFEQPSGLTTSGYRGGGAAGYVAKERLEGEPPTPAGDVFAFGGLILAAMSGKDPLWNRKNDAARIVATCMEQIPVPKEHPGLPADDPLWGLLRECWSGDATGRPTINIVLQKLESEMDLDAKTLPPTLPSPDNEWESPISVLPSHRPKSPVTQLEDKLPNHISTLFSHRPESSATRIPSPVPPAPLASEQRTLDQSGLQDLSRERPPSLRGTLTRGENCLERGGFGDVYRGTWHTPDGCVKTVAIKCVRQAQQDRNQSFETRIIRETVIWHKAARQNSNILPFIGYQLVDNVPMLVSPWCENGNLATYINRHPELGRSEKLKFLCDAARGLIHLHSSSPQIFHGDIKPQNVMVQDNLEGALSDFGISRFILDAGQHSGLTTTEACNGTSAYQAKEILNEGPPTTAADAYAFGGLILAAMSGDPPFWKKGDRARIAAICQDQTPDPVDHPELRRADSIWALLNECWSPEPASRPSAERLLETLEAEKMAPEFAPERADS